MAAIPRLQVNPFGVIPKKGHPDKWRLIVDLSSPTGQSVNDGITPDLCSLSYASIDDAVRLVISCGHGSMLAKMDLKEAYRAVPVHPVDRPLLAVKWQGTKYIDGALPFGLHSAPKLFSALLLWIILANGVSLAIHYLDDFLFVGPSMSTVCAQSLHRALTLCKELGVQVAPEKTEGPATVLTFLGIEIDTVARQLRLPSDKLQRLRSTLQLWMRPGRPCSPKHSGVKRDLLSLIGLLYHAASVVRPGRAFIQGLVDASMSAATLDHYVTLRASARADIAWWATFLPIWNGVSLMTPPEATEIIISDASGSWGCGALCAGRWFQLPWPPSWKDTPISPKELVPIVVALALWGPKWEGQKVVCFCDNMAVVFAVNKGSARDPRLMRLLHITAFFCGAYKVTLSARHVPGVKNTSAYALSRNNLPLFFDLNLQASPMPTGVPLCMQDLVLNTSLGWTSPQWNQLFSTTWRTVWQLLPERRMLRHNEGTCPSANQQE